MDDVLASLIAKGLNPKKVKAMIINYPNNPLGATATKEYFENIVKFCKKHNILLISDAAYTEMYFKPSILLCLEDGMAKGSGRSIPGFDLHEALMKCPDTVEKFENYRKRRRKTVCF